MPTSFHLAAFTFRKPSNCNPCRYGGLVLAALGFSVVSGDELRLLLSLPFFVVLDIKVRRPPHEWGRQPAWERPPCGVQG